MTNAIHTRSRGALYGLCIGDALAMPVHWYYNRQALMQDYGRVTDYLKRQMQKAKFCTIKPPTGDKKKFIITSFSKRGRTP
jgi:ADP-ribosylglycohydrolase